MGEPARDGPRRPERAMRPVMAFDHQPRPAIPRQEEHARLAAPRGHRAQRQHDDRPVSYESRTSQPPARNSEGNWSDRSTLHGSLVSRTGRRQQQRRGPHKVTSARRRQRCRSNRSSSGSEGTNRPPAGVRGRIVGQSHRRSARAAARSRPPQLRRERRAKLSVRTVEEGEAAQHAVRKDPRPKRSGPATRTAT
jgi:hypothetical protein